MDVRTWELLAKYVAGEATDREEARLEEWLEADPAHHKLLEETTKAWEAARGVRAPQPDAASAWSKLEGRMDEPEARSGRSSLAGGGEDRAATERRRRARLLSAAGALASIAAIVLVVILWRTDAEEVIHTERGSRSTAELVDGSHVHLNAESELTIVSMSDAREVRLDGEAYFEVAHDRSRPFLIRTSEGTIRVAGTAFNVNAYADEKEVRVAVADGAVAVHPASAEAEVDGEAVMLGPRQLAVMEHRRLRELRRDVDLTPHLAWREGRLVFENAPFDEVTRRLERWYDLRIEARLPTESVDRLNAVFESESVGEAISIIALALDLRFEEDGMEITFYR